METPKTGEFSGKVTVIVCQNCLDMYDRCLSRGSDYNTFSEYFTYIMDKSPELSFSEPNKISVIADSEITAVDAAYESNQSVVADAGGVSKRLAETVIPKVKDITINRNFPHKGNLKDKDSAAVFDPSVLCSSALDSPDCTGDDTSNICVSIDGADHFPMQQTRVDSNRDGASDNGIVTAHQQFKAAALPELKKKGRKPKLRLCEVPVKEPIYDFCGTANINVNMNDSRDCDDRMGMDVMDILEAEVPGMGFPHHSEPPTASCTTSQATYYSNSTATRGAVVSLVDDRRHWKGSSVSNKATEVGKKKHKIFNPNIAGSFAKTRPAFN